jgi:hypothetical protein
MPRKSTPKENQIWKSLGIIHEMTINVGQGVTVRLSTGAMHEEEWSVHFPGANNPGVGCTSATAQLLIIAANGPNTSVEYFQTQTI